MKTKLVTIFVLFTFISFDAFALSCARLTERFIVECEKGKCNRGSYVYEKPMHGVCNRRPIVEKAAQWQIDIVQKFVRSLYKINQKPTTYVLHYKTRWYQREKLQSSSALIKHYVSRISYRSDLPEIIKSFKDGNNQELLHDSDFYKKLNNAWVSYTRREIVELSKTSYDSTLAHWNEVEKNMLYKHRKSEIIDWGILIFGATFLFASIYVYFRNINRYYENRSKHRKIFIPLVYQCCLFSFSIYWALFNTWQPNKLAGFGLIVFVLWLFELVYFTYKSISVKRKNA